MLHLEYNGLMGTFTVDIPKKIICLDERFPAFYTKVLELEIEYMFDEPIVIVSNWINYEFFYAEELYTLKYINFDRVKNIKAFL